MDLEQFTSRMVANGWSVLAHEQPLGDVPEPLLRRYRRDLLDPLHVQFLRTLKECADAAGTTWFILEPMFRHQVEGFPWNQWEVRELATRSGAARAEVQDFWSHHVPLMMTTYYTDRGGWAIDTRDGCVYWGDEGSFHDDPGRVANSFADFLQRLAATGEPPLEEF